MKGFPFNVRVYGVLIQNNKILVTDERIAGRQITKLPGGGLEFGEGPKDCICREFLEESGVEVEVVKHLYTTDFFQQSAFDPNHQVISIYYVVKSISPSEQDFKIPLEDFCDFRWIPISRLTPDDFTFPIDKYVVPFIKELQQ